MDKFGWVEGGGCCESGNELSGSIKYGEFLEQQRKPSLFKEERITVS